MGTCGQFDGCAIGVRTRRIGRTYIAIGSIYRLSAPGPPLPIAKSGIGLAYSRALTLHRSSRAHMVSPKKFRREVCSNNPRLIVSFCAVCNRKAASGDLRLLVLAENLHECWPKKSEGMPPTQGSLKTKPG